MHKYQKRNWGKGLKKAARFSGVGAALLLLIEPEGKGLTCRISTSQLSESLSSVPLTSAFTFM